MMRPPRADAVMTVTPVSLATSRPFSWKAATESTLLCQAKGIETTAPLVSRAVAVSVVAVPRSSDPGTLSMVIEANVNETACGNGKVGTAANDEGGSNGEPKRKVARIASVHEVLCGGVGERANR